MATPFRRNKDRPASLTRSNGSLVAVGLGFKPACDVTLEAFQHIQSADKLFYVAPHEVMGTWLRSVNPTAESLGSLYEPGKPRHQTYREMSARLVGEVRGGASACAAFYGHPGVLAQATHWAIAELRKQGYRATMLPGISAEDCLFADLGVNPGDNGCQTFEATDFLMFKRRFDPRSALILYQVGVLGEASVSARMHARRDRLQVLAAYLLRRYPPSHPVVLYAAAVFPGQSSTVRRTSLDRLPTLRIGTMMTVYLSPLAPAASFRPALGWLRT